MSALDIPIRVRGSRAAAELFQSRLLGELGLPAIVEAVDERHGLDVT